MMFDLAQYKNILTFFAHPDDETLAAGGTIRKLTARGVNVHVAIPATGINARRNMQNEKVRTNLLQQLQNDCKKAMAILGVSPNSIYFGSFSDNEMDRHSLLDLIHWLEDIITTVNPDLIMTHHRYCTNIDHRYCHEAAIVATRPSLNAHIALICGEIPSSTGYLRPTQWEPNFFVEISETDLEVKLDAMAAYTGEIRSDPHPRSKEAIRALAKVRGSEAGFFFAEAFMISRLFA